MSKVVYIVDDQPSLRQMLRFALNLHGLHVVEAENGLDALDKLARYPVDMMIVDWQMPEMDGLVLVRHLRKSADYAELPVVIISGRDDFAARQEALSLGVMNWLKKPFRIAEVQLVVESGLGLSSLPVQHHVEQLKTGHI